VNATEYPAVGEYLERLQRSMGGLPAERREEILAQIQEHIVEGLAQLSPATDADVRNILERLGDPEDIADEARDRAGYRPASAGVVDTSGRPVIDLGVSGTPPRRRRRRLTALAASLAVLLAAGGVTAWFGATHYDPVRANHGGVFSTVRVQSGPVTRLEAVEPTSGGHPIVAFGVTYHDGQWFEYGFTLVNDSPFAVSVDQIGSRESTDPLKFVSVMINAPTVPAFGPGPPEKMVAFRAFKLPPHGARYALVRFQFHGCSLRSPEEYVTFAEQLVRLRIDFGRWSVHRSVLLPLPYSVKVAGNEGCAA